LTRANFDHKILKCKHNLSEFMIPNFVFIYIVKICTSISTMTKINVIFQVDRKSLK